MFAVTTARKESMSQTVAAVVDNVLIGLVIWVLVAGAVVYFFAGNKALMALVGLLRVGWSIVECPVRFLHRSMTSLIRGPKSREIDDDTDQYLLLHLMRIVEAGIAAVAVAILAAGTVSAWKAFIP